MDISAIALGGLNQAQTNFDTAVRRIASGGSGAPGSGAGEDTVDLSSNIVSLLQAKNDFEANLKAVKIGDEMQRTALDLLG